MESRKWWCASPAIGEGTALTSLDQLLPPDSRVIEPAEPLSIRMRGMMVIEDEDWLRR